jgi:hypothetical protein
MRATLQLAHATMRGEQRGAEQQRKMKLPIRRAAYGRLVLSKLAPSGVRSAYTASFTGTASRPSPNDGPTVRTVGQLSP